MVYFKLIYLAIFSDLNIKININSYICLFIFNLEMLFSGNKYSQPIVAQSFFFTFNARFRRFGISLWLPQQNLE